MTRRLIAIAPEEVVAFRLTRQHLHARAPRRQLISVVRDVIGLQAQVPNAAYVSLWARVAGITPEDVDHALYQRRMLVRTWAMRGTVHIMARDDLPVDLPVVALPVWSDQEQRVFGAGRWSIHRCLGRRAANPGAGRALKAWRAEKPRAGKLRNWEAESPEV